MINKIIAVITFLFSVIFLSYRKGKKDLESEQIKDLVEDYETRKKADEEFNNRGISSADREWLRKEWGKK